MAKRWKACCDQSVERGEAVGRPLATLRLVQVGEHCADEGAVDGAPVGCVLGLAACSAWLLLAWLQVAAQLTDQLTAHAGLVCCRQQMRAGSHGRSTSYS